jgi:hypothetical protein
MKPDGSELSAVLFSEWRSSYYSEIISSRDCSFLTSGFFLAANFFNALVTLDLALLFYDKDDVLFFLADTFFALVVFLTYVFLS